MRYIYALPKNTSACVQMADILYQKQNQTNIRCEMLQAKKNNNN